MILAQNAVVVRLAIVSFNIYRYADSCIPSLVDPFSTLPEDKVVNKVVYYTFSLYTSIYVSCIVSVILARNKYFFEFLRRVPLTQYQYRGMLRL